MSATTGATKQPHPAEQEAAAAAAWAETLDFDQPLATTPAPVIHHGQAARDYTDALLADVLADDPHAVAEFHAARTAGDRRDGELPVSQA